MASDSDKKAKASAVHEHLVIEAGFLGGLSFTALVLILQSPNSAFSPGSWGIWGAVYFDILVSLVAGVSVMFVMASVPSIGLAAGTVSTGKVRKLKDIVGDYFVLGFLGLLVIVPLLLVPFFWGASLAIAILEVILLARWVRG